MRPQLLPPPALKRARPELPPPTSQPLQDAMQAHGASAQLLKADEAPEKKTKKPKQWNA
jgi:hypothetical protein